MTTAAQKQTRQKNAVMAPSAIFTDFFIQYFPVRRAISASTPDERLF
jgi:hypothetical protein